MTAPIPPKPVVDPSRRVEDSQRRMFAFGLRLTLSPPKLEITFHAAGRKSGGGANEKKIDLITL